MNITVDREGQQQINSLCDAALRAGGLANLDKINTILQHVVVVDSAEKASEKQGG